MWAAVGFGVVSIPILLLVVGRARRTQPSLGVQPWKLDDIAKVHVPIMAGLAGFSITGLVLIAALTREKATTSDAFDTVVVMFVVAFLFYIGNAFLISYLPHSETSGDLAPRIHFSLATTIEYRCVFISWFALRPLMEVYGLDRPSRVLHVLLPASLVLGSTIVAMAADGLGLIRVGETYFSVLVGAGGVLLYSLVVSQLLPGARSANSALALALVIFGLNTVGYALAALTPLSARYKRVERFYRRYGRVLVVADMQLTMVALTFLWLAVVGAV